MKSSLAKRLRFHLSFFFGFALAATGLIAAPDLVIVDITINEGKGHYTGFGGDPVHMELTVFNAPPSTPSDTDQANCFRVDVHLSTDATWGSESDHQITILSGPTIERGAFHTFKWVQMMPGNLHGTFFVNAAVTIPSACSPPTDRNNNNNIYLAVNNPGSALITLQPREFPETSMVSVSQTGFQGNRLSDTPSISADGRYVAFASEATGLIGFAAGDGDPVGLVNNNHMDIYVRDEWTGEVSLISRAIQGTLSDGPSFQPQISPCGQFVTYHSFASNLVPGDTNGFADVFVFDRNTRLTRRVSLTHEGLQANSASLRPDISEGGRFVVFESEANNLVEGGNNGLAHIYLYDMQEDTIRRVSVRGAGGENQALQSANGESRNPRISADGRTVVFQSRATNLGDGNPDGNWQVYTHDRDTQGSSDPANWDHPSRIRTVQASVAVDALGERIKLDGESYQPAISADGRIVAFVSEATNIHAEPAQGTIEILGAKAAGTVTFGESEAAIGGIAFNEDVPASGTISFSKRPDSGEKISISDGVSSVTFEFVQPGVGVPAPDLPAGQVRIGETVSITRDNLVTAINNAFFNSNDDEQSMWATPFGGSGIVIENLTQGEAGNNQPINVSAAPSLSATGMGGAIVQNPNPGDIVEIDNHLTPPVTLVFFEAGTPDPTDESSRVLGVEIGRTSLETRDNLIAVLRGQIDLDIPEIPEYLLPPLMENPSEGDFFHYVREVDGEEREVTFVFSESGLPFNPAFTLDLFEQLEMAVQVQIGATVAETRGNLIRWMNHFFDYADLPELLEDRARGGIVLDELPEENTDIFISDGFLINDQPRQVRFRFEEWDDDEGDPQPFRVVDAFDIRVTIDEDEDVGQTQFNLAVAIFNSILNINVQLGLVDGLGGNGIILTHNQFGEIGNQPIQVVFPGDDPDITLRVVGMDGGVATPIDDGDIHIVYDQQILNPRHVFEFDDEEAETGVMPGRIPVAIGSTAAESIGNLLATIRMTNLPRFTVDEGENGPIVNLISFLPSDGRSIAIDLMTTSSSITVTPGQGTSHTPFDGAKIVLDDGRNGPITFEFDSSGSVEEESVRVMIGVSNAATRDNFIYAVNQSLVMMTAEAATNDEGNPVAVLKNIWEGPDGNNQIVGSDLPPSITLSGMNGGIDVPNEGEQFILDDGINPAVTFEFVAAFGNEADGNEPILIGSSKIDAAQGVIDAIKETGLRIIAIHGETEGMVRLVHEVRGSVGNRAIIVLAEEPSFEVTGMMATDGHEQLHPQVYVHNRRVDDGEGPSFDQVGNISTEAVSVTELGTLGNAASTEPSVSWDGTFVAFRTFADDLQVRTVVRSDGEVFPNENRPVQFRFDPFFGDLVIFFEGRINNFTDHGAFSDVYVRDRGTATNRRVSVNRFGENVYGILGFPFVPSSRHPAISGDGRYIAFASDAENTGGLVHGATNRLHLDQNERRDIFIHDLRTFGTPPEHPGNPPTVDLLLSNELLSIVGDDGIVLPVTTGSSIPVTASAFDSDGQVTLLEIFANGVRIATREWEFDETIAIGPSRKMTGIWTAPHFPGRYEIYAAATDNDGNRTFSATRVIEVDVQREPAPFIQFRNPSDGEVFSQHTTVPLVAVAAHSTANISRVLFFANGQLVGFSARFPWLDIPDDFEFDPFFPTSQISTFISTWSTSTAGTYELVAVAEDQFGNRVSSEVRTVHVRPMTVEGSRAPVVSLRQPVQNSTATSASSIPMMATAFDPDGDLLGVQFRINGQPAPGGESLPDGTESGFIPRQTGFPNHQDFPFSLRFEPPAPGLYVITAVGLDTSGNRTMSNARVISVTTGDPAVAIEKPNLIRRAGTNPELNTGSHVVLEATVELPLIDPDDPELGRVDGAVNRVEFFMNGQRIGADSTPQILFVGAPEQYTTSISMPRSGLFEFYVIAYDDRNNARTSDPIYVSIRSPIGAIPDILMIYPEDLSETTFSTTKSTFPVVAIASDADQDTVTNPVLVDFFVDRGQHAFAAVSGIDDDTGAIEDIDVDFEGYGYTFQPEVIIVGDGEEAQAFARMVPGPGGLVVDEIIVTNGGRNYNFAQVRLSGGGIFVGQHIGEGLQEHQSTHFRIEDLIPGKHGFGFGGLGTGAYRIYGIATDNEGNQRRSVFLPMEAQAVHVGQAFSEPPSNLQLTVSGGVMQDGRRHFEFNEFANFTLTGQDLDGRIAEVEFFFNGISLNALENSPNPVDVAPWQYAGNIVVSGDYNVFAIATDNSGVTTMSHPVWITVRNPAEPVVTIRDLPAESYVGMPLTINVIAAPGVGTVSQVQLFVNNNPLEDEEGDEIILTSPPYRFRWVPQTIGHQVITARVVNSFGQVTHSDAEGVNIVALGVVIGNPSDPERDDSFINQIYFDLLGRAPSQAEFNQFLNDLATGTRTRGEVIAKVLTLLDFELSGAPWVIAAYLTVLGDPPTVEQLEDGMALLFDPDADGLEIPGFLDIPPDVLVPANLPLLVFDILASIEFELKHSQSGLTMTKERLIHIVHNGGGTFPTNQDRLFRMQEVSRFGYLTELTANRLGPSRDWQQRTFGREVLKTALILMLLDRDTTRAEVAGLPSNVVNAAQFIVESQAFKDRFSETSHFFGIEGSPLKGVQNSVWLGTFDDTHFDYSQRYGWIAHKEHGWLYTAGEGYPEGIWLWDHIQQDWLWTRHDIYPRFYSNQDTQWLFYRVGGRPKLREFQSHDGSSWSDVFEVR